MMTEPTIEKLRALKLLTMTTAWIAQRQDPSMADLSFDERLALLVEAETLARDNKRKLDALIGMAMLSIPATKGVEIGRGSVCPSTRNIQLTPGGMRSAISSKVLASWAS